MNINKKPATRRTRQREALWQVFAQAERPLTPAEARARTAGGVGIATAYRAARQWLEEGRLKAVCLPGAPSRFERAELAHHHHFCCDGCGRVFDLKGCPLTGRPRLPRGFRAVSHQITFRGWCRACGAKAAGRTPQPVSSASRARTSACSA